MSLSRELDARGATFEVTLEAYFCHLFGALIRAVGVRIVDDDIPDYQVGWNE